MQKRSLIEAFIMFREFINFYDTAFPKNSLVGILYSYDKREFQGLIYELVV